MGKRFDKPGSRRAAWHGGAGPIPRGTCRRAVGIPSWTPKGPHFFFCLGTPFFFGSKAEKRGPLGVQVVWFTLERSSGFILAWNVLGV